MKKNKTNKEDKIVSIELNVVFGDGYRVETFIHRPANVKSLLKENPVLQRISDGELA